MRTCNALEPHAVSPCPRAPAVLVSQSVAYHLKAHSLPECSAAQQSRARSKNIALAGGRGWGVCVCVGGGRRRPNPPREHPAAQGLSLLSQVKFWKPQPLITAWHRAPSGFRVACIDLRSVHRTWVWAKFKHRQTI